ncbi:formate dehydrogenase subunit delta [Ornithinimicrobium sp. LYQ103]|uniref:formate dehydrogenase subunit delta n=1 Tax=Ornithinimicrobium sp. LYQ103 TaxID=3378796 RepID=UPI003853D816
MNERPQVRTGSGADAHRENGTPDLDAPTRAEPAPTQGPASGSDVDAEQRQHEPADVRMGHDIARAMAHHPPRRAAEEIATHLRKFWDPRMRASILARADRGEPMDELLRAGVELLREGEIDPSEVRKPSGG